MLPSGTHIIHKSVTFATIAGKCFDESTRVLDNMFLVTSVFLYLFSVGNGDSNSSCTCPQSNLQRDYCSSEAIVLGHVRLKGSLTSELEYYLINIPHVIRRSFKVRNGLTRVVTRADNCGAKLEVGSLHILGVDQAPNSSAPDSAIEVMMDACSLNLKYTEISDRIRGALTKRRIDCSCSMKECEMRACTDTMQEHVSDVTDYSLATSCLERSSFCGQYDMTGTKRVKERKCCWSVDLADFTGCISEPFMATLVPPTEDIPSMGP